MKNLKNTLVNLSTKFALAIALGLTITSCSPPAPSPTATCSTTTSDFQTIYNNVLTSNSAYDDYVNMDLVTHEYTFTMLTNKSVCQIGYQGNANLYASSIPYTIEIYNNTTSILVYSGNHVFNSAFTDYVTPTGPTINLVNGNSYTIKRIAANYLSNIGNTIGRICRFNSAPFPSAATGTGIEMQITGSDFYGTGGPVPNFGIPYIDIIFQ